MQANVTCYYLYQNREHYTHHKGCVFTIMLLYLHVCFEDFLIIWHLGKHPYLLHYSCYEMIRDRTKMTIYTFWHYTWMTLRQKWYSDDSFIKTMLSMGFQNIVPKTKMARFTYTANQIYSSILFCILYHKLINNTSVMSKHSNSKIMGFDILFKCSNVIIISYVLVLNILKQ